MNDLKPKIIILGLIVIIPILLLIFYKKDIVKTVKKGNDSTLPEIEIDSATVDYINKYIAKLYAKYTSDGKSKMTYTYYTYGDIVSVLVNIKEYDANKKIYIQKYLSFNVNKETKVAIANDDLVTLFGYDMLDIAKKIEERIKQYYETEVEENYVDSNCNYSCYLKTYREVDYAYYTAVFAIEDSKPVVYLNLFNKESTKDYEFFDNLDYNPYKITLE